jgi:hypothetical protein
MQLNDSFDGSADAFEGDRTLLWRSLPVNAQVTKATIRLTPTSTTTGTLFEEIITFDSTGVGTFGTTKATGSGFVEVDFHKRRTSGSVTGDNVTDANLQVDLGGVYLEINATGAVKGGPTDSIFKVPADGRLPGLTVSKFKMTQGNPPAGVVDISTVTIHSVPTNVTLRLGAMAPFWTRVGEMTQSELSPDFTPVLQAFLATAQVENGYYNIPLVLHSDAVTRLSAEVEVEYLVERSIGPVDVNDVVLVFDVGGRAKA